MKIRDRLALFFSFSAAGIILVLSLLVYYGSAVGRKQQFFKALQEEVKYRGQEWQNSNGLYTDSAQTPQEKIHAIDIKEKLRITLPFGNTKDLERSLTASFPAGFVEQLIKDGNAEFRVGELEGVGQLFQKEGGKLAVVVAANDRLGKAQLNKLKNMLIAGFLLSVPLLYLLGRLYLP